MVMLLFSATETNYKAMQAEKDYKHIMTYPNITESNLTKFN